MLMEVVRLTKIPFTHATTLLAAATAVPLIYINFSEPAVIILCLLSVIIPIYLRLYAKYDIFPALH